MTNLFTRKTLATVGTVTLAASLLLGIGTTNPANAAPVPTSGQVFNDINFNGTLDPGEVGVPGVTVKVYDDTGTLIGTTLTVTASPSTDPTGGTWSVAGTDTAQSYRVEYSNLQGYQPGPSGPVSFGFRSTVQFVAGGSTISSLGVINPQSFNGASTNVISAIQMNGDPADVATNLTGFTSVTNHPYSSTGVLGGGVAATQTDTGTVFGIGVNRVTQKIYAGAYVKRHAGLGGPNGDAAGAIYEINPTTAAVTGTITIPNTGPVPSNTTRGLPADRSISSVDAYIWPMVGTTGLGGVEVSDDGKTLWAVNMFDKSLYSVDLASGATTGTLVSAIPDPGCVNGAWRPMGLKYHLGKLYAGGVCDASIGGTAADLSAVVQVFDPATGTWAATPALSVPLNYPRQDIYSGSLQGDFLPWTDDWAAVQASNLYGSLAYPMPMLGDIEFLDDGSMVIAIRDRAGDLLGAQNVAPDGSAEDVFAGGDTLRAAPPATVGGSYVMEVNGSVNGLLGSNFTSNSGPGGAEFYSGEGWGVNGVQDHHETSVGGLAFKSGSGQIVNAQYDPFVEANAGGYGFLQNSTGALSAGAEVYAGKTEFFGKANGMAELELLTEAAPIEIGNRVWLDADRDGVQDPSEAPIAGVEVQLFDAAGVLVGMTTTDANGNYVFVGVKPNTAYTIEIATGQGSLAGLVPTVADAAAVSPDDTQNDSDSDGVPDSATAPTKVVAAVLTGGPGANDHTFDFGFHLTPLIDLSLAKTLKTTGVINPGSTVLFGLIVTNNGPGSTTKAFTVTDMLPAGLIPVSASGAGFVCNAPVGQEVTCTQSPFVALAANGTAVEIVVEATVGLSATGSLTNVAKVVPGVGEIVESNLLGTENVGYETGDPTIGSNNDDSAVLTVTTPTTTTTTTTMPPTTVGVTTVPVTTTTVPVATTVPVTTTTVPVATTVPVTTTTVPVVTTVPVLASLGDTVWSDTDHDGVQDSTETGVAGITVNLLDVNGVVIGTTTTDSNGKYSFDNLIPGTYSVEFVKATLPAGMVFTTQGSGTDRGTDSNADTTTGRSAPVTLVAGERNPTIDAGIWKPASLGDTVWFDVDRDGVQDSTETGVPGITVNLLDVNGVVIGTTTTDSNGKYSFDNLTPGTYSVEFVKATLPAGMVFTTQGSGTYSGTDSNADTTTGRSAPVTLVAGERNPTIDAGIWKPTVAPATTVAPITVAPTTIAPTTIRPTTVAPAPVTAPPTTVGPKAAIGNYVWFDDDRDGFQDPSEIGVAGVKVTLLDSNGKVVASTVTNSTGGYIFDGLMPGDYQVVFDKSTLPDGFVLTGVDAGNDATDSDADSNGRTPIVSLAANERNMTIDAGLNKVLTIVAPVAPPVVVAVWSEAPAPKPQVVVVKPVKKPVFTG